jgi:hypothetical protein
VAADVSDERIATPSPAKPSAPARKEPHRVRFLFLYGTLGAVVAAAIAGIVLLASSSSSSSKSSSGPVVDANHPWSAWTPMLTGVDPIRQIANHVGSSYRLDGHQLLSVTARVPSVPTTTGDLPISAVGVPVGSGSAVRGDLLTSDTSQEFVLCGTGSLCTISFGKPSVARGLMVRREALELALYTFKYIPNVNSVLTLIPAAPGDTTHHFAAYYTRSDLEPELRRPLTATIATHSLPKEEGSVDQLARRFTYEYTLQQGLGNDAVMFLQPFGP